MCKISIDEQASRQTSKKTNKFRRKRILCEVAYKTNKQTKTLRWIIVVFSVDFRLVAQSTQ